MPFPPASRSFLFRATAAAVLAVAAAGAQAQVRVSDAWLRASVPQQKATGGFLQLQSSVDSRLVGARSPVATTVEIHEMSHEGGVMKMRAVPALDLPAGKTVALAPGSFHLMFFDLRQPLSAGDTVPITLEFEDRDGKRTTQEVQAAVRPLNAAAPQPAGQGAHDPAGHSGGHSH
ncbi:copper chaperone PCu(A)C [Xylophilus sp.]|uniref:copper chaperone PCu(A)C n=1 Tax=Xylophilus sp. TaxID=2653893 RepID=UPI0013B80D02|nr:copper chaperone PCu(A)C [Xylophilus sp.]KAF1050319.1 MAG: hypothetical protein GAK38_00345 [Xylophilus sp.]